MVFTFKTMMWLALGVFIGVGMGAMPGLSAGTGIALMLPLTFTLPHASALGLLIGLYKGAVFGGSISAISFATPGTPSAAATVFDGYKMMQRGQGRKALLIALYASVSADFLSDVITILVAPAIGLGGPEIRADGTLLVDGLGSVSAGRAEWRAFGQRHV